MAVTSIWPIKGRVDKVINYARNPEKTHDKEKLSELHEIEGVVEYAADEMKTEKRAYLCVRPECVQEKQDGVPAHTAPLRKLL